MKKVIVLLIGILLIISMIFGSTIKELNFETAGGYSTNITEFSDGSDDFFTRTDSTNISDEYNVTNVQGSWYFAAQDIDGEGATLPVTLTLDDIDINGYTDLSFSIYLAEDDDGVSQDWDDVDYVHIDYDIDNSGSFSNLIWLENDGSQYNTAPFLDTDFDGIGDSTEITSVFTKFENNIDTTGSTIDIRITFNLNSGDEDIAIDEILITGNYSAGVENPTNFISTASSISEIDLSWGKNSNDDSVMITYSMDGNFGTPTDSTYYSIDDTISGGGTVIYKEIGTSFNHSSLSANTKYYYKAMSFDSLRNYSSGVTDNATTFTDEPTNHVTGFTVTANGYDQIDLTWTETDGTQAPAGYLIKASTSDNITNPTDSTAVSDNATIGDNSGAKNIFHGTASYEWAGLDTETPYYFKIYPYTNSGIDIDYKTDGTIPNGNATTGIEPAAPTAGDLYITEVCGDGVDAGTDNGFMEIYNYSDHTISLRNVEARYYNTNPNDPSQTVTLSGEIDSSAFVIVTQNETNFNAAYTPVTADFIGSSFYFNGGDDGCDIYYVTTTTILDKFNNNGVSATPWTWNDNYTYERNSINSGADSLNWTEITSGIATPGATNSTPLSDDVSIKENYTKIADKYELGNTYPNPFNPTFTIPLKLNENAFVNIHLVNILGQKVLQIENSQMAVGDNDLQVNCENLNSGVYFVKVTVDNVNNIQKVVLLK
ncbi:MAG: T9SS type A sorting domain-containing protein [Candidatus Marinimicrobia bacterium]|jgi:hypothetical protein|nr:T9SS type A sorting domain-containing protein [Candidatus Neomarinimicrobiota bacterium]